MTMLSEVDHLEAFRHRPHEDTAYHGAAQPSSRLRDALRSFEHSAAAIGHVLVDEDTPADRAAARHKKPLAHDKVQEQLETTAVAATGSVSRTYEHLHYPTYMFWCSCFTAARTVIYHPMTLALARKQGLPEYADWSARRVLRDLLKYEGGAVALTTGMFAMVLANAVSEAIYCGAFEFLRFKLPFDSEVSRDATAGYSSDVMCRFIYTPLLLVSNRQMTQTARTIESAVAPGAAASRRAAVPVSSNGMLAVARSVYMEGGAAGFFRGLGATLTVGCSWTAVWWPTYTQSKKALYAAVGPLLPEPSDAPAWAPAMLIDRDDNAAINAAASVVASGSTAVLFNPFLVVRTRVQIQRGATCRSVAREVYQQAGIRGFFAGTMLNVSACVADGIMAASCYEWAKYLADSTRCC